MTDENPYDWWTRALADERLERPEEPQPGRYRLKTGAKGYAHPVAIWPNAETGKLQVLIGNSLFAEDDTGESAFKYGEFCELTWPGCIPVSAADYDAAKENGEWPDLTRSRRGHNQPPDEFELLQEAVESAIQSANAELKENLEIHSKELADRFANMADRLRELRKKADDMRKAEAQPFDEGKRRVQAKYKPILEDVKDMEDRLKAPLTAFLREQERIAAEAARKAREEAEAEARARAEEKAKAEAAERGEEADLSNIEIDAVEIPKVETAPTKVGGYGGKRTSLRKKVHAEIEDFDMALEHFKEHRDVQELIQKLANRAIRDGFTVPGVKRIEERVAA